MANDEKIPMDLSGQTFTRGVELADNRFMLTTQDPGLDIETQPHTGFCYWTAEDHWLGIGLGSKLTADATTSEDGKMMLMIDPTGFIHEMDGRSVEKDFIKNAEGEIPDAPFRCIRRIGNKVFAAGVDRQVYCRDSGSWKTHSSSEMMTSDRPAAVQGIDGFSPNEIYTAGWDGELWGFSNDKWRQLESPTNVVLNDIATDGKVCVAVGLAGVVVGGRGDDWEVYVHDETDEPFWSVRAFGDAFYLSALSGIYRLKDNELTLFKELDAGMRTTYALSVGPSGIWSVGANDVCLFDGKEWRTIGQS